MIIIIPLTQIKVQRKIHTFINNTNNNTFKFNLLFLGFNTTAIGANRRTSTIKKIKDVIQTRRANKIF
jgi:hypothetical protein